MYIRIVMYLYKIIDFLAISALVLLIVLNDFEVKDVCS